MKTTAHNAKPLLVIITGPTASGKTALAIDIARHYNTEIVSADSRQLYAALPVGTAAPTDLQLQQAKHHMVGTLPLDAYYSAACFEHDALEILRRIWLTNRVAIVCGGSMMYIDALTDGIDEMPTVSDATRRYVLSLLETQGLDTVLAQLEIVDPATAAAVDRHNTRRVVHALEVSLQAGVPYSSLRTGRKKPRPFDIIRFAIDMPRQELFGRIGLRVEQMFALGLTDEARRAFDCGDFNSLNTVGYKELKPYFAGTATLDDTKAKIARNTRVYAKKQLTWMKSRTDIHMLNPSTAYADAITIIDQFLSGRDTII